MVGAASCDWLDTATAELTLNAAIRAEAATAVMMSLRMVVFLGWRPGGPFGVSVSHLMLLLWRETARTPVTRITPKSKSLIWRQNYSASPAREAGVPDVALSDAANVKVE
jgi:hypothetical protein